ncbi:hypothetical protein ACHAPT_006152 [Fusarium lateritium]
MPLSQPWKAFWPPTDVNTQGTSHGCPAGTTLWSMGSSVSNPRDKEVPAPKNEAKDAGSDGSSQQPVNKD